jgi:hypothetical protein
MSCVQVVVQDGNQISYERYYPDVPHIFGFRLHEIEPHHSLLRAIRTYSRWEKETSISRPSIPSFTSFEFQDYCTAREKEITNPVVLKTDYSPPWNWRGNAELFSLKDVPNRDPKYLDSFILPDLILYSALIKFDHHAPDFHHPDRCLEWVNKENGKGQELISQQEIFRRGYATALHFHSQLTKKHQ